MFPKSPAPKPSPPAPKTQPQPLDCDKPGDDTLTVNGAAKKWETSDDPVYYLSPGMSFCEEVYTDQSNVVCVSSGHFPKGSLKSCNEWVQVTNKQSGVVSFGRILDQCGAVPNSTFGCNDIYLSKQMFIELAGKDANGAIQSGHLDQVEWRKVTPPCFGLWAGLPGKMPDGSPDNGQGQDTNGFLRCGKKTGEDRVVGADVAKVCNKNIKDCKQADQIRKTLPKYGGKAGAQSGAFQSKAVAYHTDSLELVQH